MWRYHTINATIWHHGALNGLTTETYEAFRGWNRPKNP